MIKNDFMFKIAFYLFVLDCSSIIGFDIESLEKQLKDYLMYHGYKCFVHDEHHIIKSIDCRDLDQLVIIFNKEGSI